MTAALNDFLQAVNQYLSETAGLYFSEMRFSDLARGIRNGAEELGYDNAINCIEDMLSGKFGSEHLQTIVRNLTVGETYFFRDTAVFLALEEKILPEISRKRRAQKVLRIWSAGCSTGEEPYSIAISLLRAIPDISSWKMKLFASDINTQSLEKARRAGYGSWSFRTTPDDFLDTYFEASPESKNNNGGQEFKLKEHIRNMVQFGYLNLAEDNYPSAHSNTKEMDLIFCRNVLIYFTQEKCKEIADKLAHCLAPDGVLVTSASDSSRFISAAPAGLERISTTMFLKKADRR